MIILTILGFLLLLILTIILALLFIPFDYHVHGEKYETAFLQLMVSWLFGGIGIYYSISTDGAEGYIRILGMKIAISPGKHHKEKEKKKHVSYLRKDFIERLLKAIGEMLNHIKPRRFEVNGCFGFEDPYNTSILWLCILALPLHHKNFNINITPAFYDEILEGRFIIEGRMVLAVLLWIAAKLRLSRPVKNIIKERKKKIYAT